MKFLLVALFIVMDTLITMSCAADASGLDWVKKERIRAGYGGPCKTEQEFNLLMARLNANGFNAYFLKTDFDASRKEKWDELAARADTAQKHGIRLFLCCNFLGECGAKALAGLRSRYTVPEGPRMKTACPLDEQFWQKVVADRALQASKLSKEHPGLVGFIVDPEMYSADTTTYGPPCLCDDCFKKYLLSALCTAVAPEVPFAERTAYLMKREGSEKEYPLILSAHVGTIAKSIRKLVRAEAPEFLLGWLLFEPDSHWFSNAVIDQWADENVPVLIAPERTYFVGYSKALVDAKVETLKAAGLNALFLPGIGWDPNYPCLEPEHLPAHLFLCATKGHGYWVWHVPYKDDPQAEKYWAAFKLGNDEIAKWAASSGTYQTGLKLTIAPPSAKPEAVERFVKIANTLAPAMEGASPAPKAHQKPTRLRGAHQIYILVQAGEGLSVRFTAHNLADLPGPCGYFVFDANGNELKRGDFDVGRPAIVEIPNAKPGAYLIAITSRGPTYSFVSKNRFLSIEAAPLHPIQYSNPLYFFVPKKVSRFSIHIVADTTSETATAKLFDPNGNLVAQDTTVNKGPFTLDVTVPAGLDGKAWRVELSKGEIGIYEDVLLSFSKEIPPFVAESACTLITPR